MCFMNLIVKCGSRLQPKQLSLTKDSRGRIRGHFVTNVQVYGRHDRVVYFVCREDQFLNDEQPNNTDICIRAQWLAIPRE